MISFTVYGRAQPAGSKKGFPIKKGGQYTGRVVITDDAKHSRGWKNDVSAEARAVAPKELLRGPLQLFVTFYFQRPKWHYRTGKNAGQVRPDAPHSPAVKPDLTKLVRAVEDALNGLVWADDALVTMQVIQKRYGTPERCEVLILPESAPKPAHYVSANGALALEPPPPLEPLH